MSQQNFTEVSVPVSGFNQIMKGIRQGETLSPVLFIAVVEEIFMRMNIEAGINISGVRLSNLRFVDNISYCLLKMKSN